MADESEWSKRLGEAMAGTVQEQLRALVIDAQDKLRSFAEAAVEQSGALEDAHRRIVTAQHQFEAGIRELRTDLAQGLDELRQVATAAREQAAEVGPELQKRLGEVTARQTEALERSAAELKELAVRSDDERRAADSALQTKFAAAINSVSERMRASEERVERRQDELDLRLREVLAKLDDSSFEERTARRLLQLLASSFAELGAKEIDVTDPAAPKMRQTAV